jgi:hypothetical protein
MVLSTNVQKQNSGRVNSKATGRAGQTYTANPVAAGSLNLIILKN